MHPVQNPQTFNLLDSVRELKGCLESIQVLTETIEGKNPRINPVTKEQYLLFKGRHTTAFKTLAYLEQRARFLKFIAMSNGATTYTFDKYGIEF